MHPHRHRHLLRTMLPPLTAMLVLAVAAGLVLLPAMGEALLDSRRDLMREITHSAANLLRHFHHEEAAGRLDRSSAQAEAIAAIRALRYGDTDKDYLWISDLDVRMVMHPYRRDLEGEDLRAISDPDGRRLFAIYTAAVRADPGGQAFVTYRWQHQDDADHIVPKLSHVRLFEPWGWIVGSGLYLEDVAAAQRGTLTRFAWTVLATSLPIIAVLAWLAVQTWRAEEARAIAAAALHDSRERYRALVDGSAEAVMLVEAGRILAVNPACCALLDRDAHQLEGQVVAEVLGQAGPAGDGSQVEAQLPSGHRVLLASSAISLVGRPAQVLTARRLDRNDPGEPGAWQAEAAERSAILFEQVARVDAAAAAWRLPLSALASAQAPQATVATVGLPRLRPDLPVAAALAALVAHPEAEAVLSTDANGQSALLSWRTLAAAILARPEALTARIAGASAGELPNLRRETAAMQVALLTDGASALRIIAVGSEVADSIAARCCQQALEQVGTAPCPWTWLALGSQGRSERCLFGDHDDALIIADEGPIAAAWAAAFAAAVASRLEAAGYPRCHGAVMATNPHWRRSLSSWRSLVAGWLSAPSAQDLIDVSVFADCRAIAGDPSQAAELRAILLAATRASDRCLRPLAEEILARRSDDDASEEAGAKHQLLRLVDAVRLLALRHGLAATGTVARLRALAAAGVLTTEDAEDLSEATAMLLDARLRAQARRLADPFRESPRSVLSPWRAAALRRIPAGLALLQSNLRASFIKAG